MRGYLRAGLADCERAAGVTAADIAEDTETLAGESVAGLAALANFSGVGACCAAQDSARDALSVAKLVAVLAESASGGFVTGSAVRDKTSRTSLVGDEIARLAVRALVLFVAGIAVGDFAEIATGEGAVDVGVKSIASKAARADEVGVTGSTEGDVAVVALGAVSGEVVVLSADGADVVAQTLCAVLDVAGDAGANAADDQAGVDAGLADIILSTDGAAVNATLIAGALIAFGFGVACRADQALVVGAAPFAVADVAQEALVVLSHIGKLAGAAVVFSGAGDAVGHSTQHTGNTSWCQGVGSSAL